MYADKVRHPQFYSKGNHLPHHSPKIITIIIKNFLCELKLALVTLNANEIFIVLTCVSYSIQSIIFVIFCNVIIQNKI